MSKKFEALKKAVFYSEQNPDMLAEILEGTVSDVLTSIAVLGDDVVTAPTGDTDVTSTYTSKKYSQFGDEMNTGTVTLALKSAVTGVSISEGVVTITKNCTSEAFTVKGTSGSVVGEKTVKVLVPKTITVSGDDSIEIPSGDTANTAEYSAIVKNQDGDTIESPTVTYALKSAVTGVSVSGNTVSVAKTATAEGFTLVATCGGASVEIEVALTAEA